MFWAVLFRLVLNSNRIEIEKLGGYRPRRAPHAHPRGQPASTSTQAAARLRAGHRRRRATWRVSNARHASLGRGFERRGQLGARQTVRRGEPIATMNETAPGPMPGPPVSHLEHSLHELEQLDQFVSAAAVEAQSSNLDPAPVDENAAADAAAEPERAAAATAATAAAATAEPQVDMELITECWEDTVGDMDFMDLDDLQQVVLSYTQREAQRLGTDLVSSLRDRQVEVCEETFLRQETEVQGATATGIIANGAWSWLQGEAGALRFLLYPPPRKTAEEIIAELLPQTELIPRDMTKNDPYNRRGAEHKVLTNINDTAKMADRIATLSASGDARRQLRRLRQDVAEGRVVDPADELAQLVPMLDSHASSVPLSKVHQPADSHC